MIACSQEGETDWSKIIRVPVVHITRGHSPMASFFSLAWMAAARLEVESRLGLVVILAFSRALSTVADILKLNGID